jgi:hypothetical protein
VQSIIHVSTQAVVHAFANETLKTNSSEDIDYNKIVMLEARVCAIEGVDLYDPVQAAKMYLVLNVIVPKKFCVLEFIKYTGTQ